MDRSFSNNAISTLSNGLIESVERNHNTTFYFVENGLTAPEGMKSVFPTFTYPCHQSMITGTNPATHKTFNNGIFDPIGEHLGAWHWFANTEVKTLWEAAKENGY